jgi:parvulin-like peptidyl-prolyl isomerase
MNLLNQAKQNDLALYNKYANAKLDNQLNYEMQDLTVTDPKQLRANLSNVLDQYYDTY